MCMSQNTHASTVLHYFITALSNINTYKMTAVGTEQETHC